MVNFLTAIFRYATAFVWVLVIIILTLAALLPLKLLICITRALLLVLSTLLTGVDTLGSKLVDETLELLNQDKDKSE